MLYQILAFTIHWKIYKKNKKIKNRFKTSAPTWNEEFELADESQSASNIPDYFKYVLTKHEALTDNTSIMIYVNKIENRITDKVKT